MQEKNSGVSVADRVEAQTNRYYLGVSRRYAGIGIVLMVLFFLYVFLILTFFGEYVTYDNLKYLVRDWNAMTVSGEVEFTSIVYPAGERMRFRPFRGGIAITDADSYHYYDATGIQLVDDACNFADPATATSAKYLLLYDIGGTGYAVYNQLTEIIRRTADNRIIAGDIADDGSMLLVTRSRETRFVATVYNEAFSPTMHIYKENFVLDAAISPDGDAVVLVSAVPSDSDFYAEIELCRVGEENRVARLTYEHTMPLDVVAREDGFVLLCDNGLYFLDYEGHITKSTGFDGMSLAYADVGGVTSAVVGHVNALGSENHILVLDAAGEILYDSIVRARITGVYASVDPDDALVYYTTTDGVVKVYPDGSSYLHQPENGDVLAVLPVEGGALLCRESGASRWAD